jgi:hypothetical protein
MRWIIIPLTLILTTVKGQVNQIWLDVNLQQKIKNQWSWIADGGVRFTLQESLSIAFVRGGIVYKLNSHLEVMGGFGYFLYNSSPSGITGNELRPWQGVRLNFNLGTGILLTNYTRLEERIIYREDADDFFLRFRNFTGLTFTLFRNNEKSTSLYLPVSFEFFEDLNEQLFVNRHRTYLGLGCSFSKYRLEIHYISQQGRFNRANDFELTENIYRVRWFINL